jgi:hyperosmotically inducible protein
MRIHKPTLAILAASTFALAACDRSGTPGSVDAPGPGRQPIVEAANHAADDTGVNARDRSGDTVTPLDQSNEAADIALTQRIRQGIAANESLSVEARNVKVIAQRGAVTLRGPVKTEAEKESIESLARTAGAISVDSQLEIGRDGSPGAEE